MRSIILSVVVLFSFLIVFASAVAQVSAIESPVVHPDRTVTFTLKAPNAKKVEISTQFIKGSQSLLMDQSGVWSITLGPVDPNIYSYNFIVDGVSVADPNNIHIFPNEHFKSSLLDVPGDYPAIYSVQNVPHGQISYCTYNSKTLNAMRPLLVYTPPGYNKNSNKYPVFYLISGTTDTEETWFKVGKVNFILDNLLAQKKAVPIPKRPGLRWEK